MRSQVVKWSVLCLLLLAGGLLFWQWQNRLAEKSAAAKQFSFTAPRPSLPGQTPALKSLPAQAKAALATNQFALRLNNTPRSLAELMNDGHAILLENALIDTERPLDFSIPKHLRAQGDPGAYIVQSRGSSGAAFRASLARAGAQIVSYIPNNAYLVRIPAGGARALAGDPLTQTVIPWEPYYGIQSSLLRAAVGQEPLPEGAVLNLGIFADGSAQTIGQIEKLGGKVLAQDRSPFGLLLRVAPPQNWTALASLPGVQIVEPFHRRVAANDLSRVETGVSVDTLTNANYLGLSGSNVMVEVNDSGIDATHPDFTTGGNPTTAGGPPVRVFALTPGLLVDTDGHGTFIAGEIAGNGAASINPTPVGAVLASMNPMNSACVSNADFRGKAPLAKLFAMNFQTSSDQDLQEQAALTNAPISNNSWNFDGDNDYDLEAASYDAATRDALPFTIGSQPVLFVFSAGNSGGGDDLNDPGGGTAGSIESPATGKNVISVGAIQLLRNITNSVTNSDGTIGQPWLPETSTSYRVAGFSSRGNVGIGTEGTFGRFKPDVVTPGTFVVSTRSAQWDTNAYFFQNPLSYDIETFPGIVLGAGSDFINGFPLVPVNAISVSILVSANINSPSPFPTLPISVGLIGSPFNAGSSITPQAVPNLVTIPSDGNYTIGDILNSESFFGFNYGISNSTANQITFDVTTTIVSSNTVGNQSLVLSNLDNTIGPFYRFESGTSMSAASVSGVLALMQDFFQNHSTLTTPSPALLKALLINGARPTGAYDLQVDNNENFIGWGLVNLPNSLPPTIQTNFSGSAPSSIFIQDQSPTNALATGDQHTFKVLVQSNSVPLRVTLAWTDPPGNPSAAIKLVNSLELVVTNTDGVGNPMAVYYGNDIPAHGFFNNANPPTNPFIADNINNVQNVIIPATLGTNYTVAVIGRAVNVNAVSAQTNDAAGTFAPNVVQDYALIISSGDGGSTGLFTITGKGVVANPTAGQNVTYVASTNSPLLHQTVGANPPLLNASNTLILGNNTQWSSTGELTVGMTNQWHFYVVTNHATDASGVTADVTNAAFATFTPPTLSIPRMGVFAGADANATRLEADIDVYVASGPSGPSGLINLNPEIISNCLAGGQINKSVAGVFYGASLTRGGAEFVVDSNSTPGQVYYVGVKSEDQMASEYSFIPIFSSIPFSTQDEHGDQHVFGAPVPVDIPDGTTAHPGINYVFGFALYPINVQNVTVTNVYTHENFGDLFGTLTHEGGTTPVESVVNNHDAYGTIFDQGFVYDDSSNLDPATVPTGPPYNYIVQPTDPPGNLQTFYGKEGSGMWILTEVDDALTQTGRVQSFSMFIKKRTPLTNGSSENNQVGPQQWFYDFVDVPPGATNLTISVTNLNGAPLNALTIDPLLVFVKLGAQPTTNNFDKAMVIPIAPPPPGNSMSIGPTDVPPLEPERYWIGVFNPSATVGADPQTFKLSVATLPQSPTTPLTDFAITGNNPLLDDAVSDSDFIDISSTESIVSVNVGIRVDHPRISDLVFHLIAPDGTRYLLMENRGGDTTNGAGATYVITNTVNVTANGTSRPNTNYINAQEISGTVPITYDFFTVPDEMTIYYGTNVTPPMLILDTGFTNNPSGPQTLNVTFGPTNAVVSTYLTIVMNQFGNPNGSQWTYTFGGVVTNYSYLTFTEDTNLTTTPIKYAVPPFIPPVLTATNVWTDSFEAYAPGSYPQGSIFGNWTVLTNQVIITTNPPAFDITNMLSLENGVVSNTLPTIAGRKYLLNYAQGTKPLTALFAANKHGSPSPNPISIEEFDLAGNASAFDSTLFNPIALAFDSGGNLYASDSGDTSIEVFPRGGQKSVYIPSGNPYLNFAAAMTFDGSGNLYVADFGSDALYRFTPPGTNGTLLATAANGLNGPEGLAFDGAGNLYVGNNLDNNIWKFAPPYTSGVLFANIGNPLAGGLESLAFGPSNNLYAADAVAGVVYQISPTAVVTIFANVPNASALVFDSNTNLYVADSDDNLIYQIPPGGVPSLFASSGLDFPRALAFYTSNSEDTNSANWQVLSKSFTASRANQPLVLDGSGGSYVNGSGSVITNVFGDNALFDNFSLTEVPGDLYYLPEQSLSTIAGTSAFGIWQLEIQDDRAGAFDSNGPPVLVSWELQFVLANTNSVPSVLLGGAGQTNFLPAGDIAWYKVIVPVGANFATNRLLVATDPSGAPAPVKWWFDTNTPPATNILFLNGLAPLDVLLSTTTTNSSDPNYRQPPNIYQDQTYYLGVQNPNNFTLKYGIRVNFDVPGLNSLHISSVSTSGGAATLHWTGAPDAVFRVQWTDSLDSPVQWQTATSLITSNTGQFSFTDNGSQTAPLGPQRYYRIVQISP